MVEAIIKYAVNSSLGTEEFESLDVKIVKLQEKIGTVEQVLDILLNGSGENE